MTRLPQLGYPATIRGNSATSHKGAASLKHFRQQGPNGKNANVTDQNATDRTSHEVGDASAAGASD